jgi:hypothetical protein
MLRSLKDLENYEIGATDGSIGHVKDFYFDDHRWVIRYLVVDAGTWLSSRKVLISPISIQRPNWAERMLPVAITKEQVRNSPSIDTDKPVSRQNEMDYLGHYGYPYYWDGAGIWGEGMYPYGMYPGYVGYASPSAERDEMESAYENAERARHWNDDPHLRSCKEVVGYHVHATDGEIGHVEALLVDEKTWAIRYIVVNTSNWGVGRKVLIAPQWITDVRWLDGSVAIDLSRDAVKDSPLYESTAELNRERESGIYAHYGRPGYWTDSRLREPESVV